MLTCILCSLPLYSAVVQGSTVNMNIMGWVYSRVADLIGSKGPSTLGTALMIGTVCVDAFQHVF